MSWSCSREETCEITVQASDPRGNVSKGALTIECVESPPFFTTTPPEEAREADAYVYDFECDSDRFGLLELVVGESDTCGGELHGVILGAGEYRFTPDESQGGETCQLHLRCENSEGLVKEQRADVFVSETNTVPTLQLPEGRSNTTIGAPGMLTLFVTDADRPRQRLEREIISHDCAFEPEINAAEGTLRWTCPRTEQACEVQVRVSDDFSPPGVDEGTLTIACVDNIPPPLVQVSIYPPHPLPGEPLDCEPVFGEGGGEEIAPDVVWLRDEQVIGASARLPAGVIRSGDRVRCEATTARVPGTNEPFADEVEVRVVELLRDLEPRSSGARLWRRGFEDNVFFTTENEDDVALWVTDPTGQSMLELVAWSPSSSGEAATVTPLDARLDTGVFFLLEDHLQEGLWFTDGTVSGTSRLTSSTPLSGEVFVPDGSLRAFLVIEDSIHGAEPWVSDGTAAGTTLLTDVHLGTASSFPQFSRDGEDVLGSDIFFIADDGVHGREIWRTDGTPQGTSLLFDFADGASDGVDEPPHVLDQSLLFVAVSPTLGQEWHTSDGTLAGTRVLRDIDPGPGAGVVSASTHRVASRILFEAKDPVHGEELWSTDGTTQGTVLLEDFTEGVDGGEVSELATVDNGEHVLFWAGKGVARRLWISDGSVQGTAALTSDAVTPFAMNDVRWSEAVERDGKVYFVADDGVHGAEVWVTDGSEQGTSLLRDLTPPLSPRGYVHEGPRDLLAFGEYVYFAADDGLNGTEVWRTDGTAAGTELFADLLPGARSSGPSLASSSSGLVFLARDRLAGRELWGSDGVTPGANLISDFQGPSRGSEPSDFLTHRGVLYFTASVSRQREFFKFDPLGGGEPAVIGSPYESAGAEAPMLFGGEVVLGALGHDGTPRLLDVSGAPLGLPDALPVSEPVVVDTANGQTLVFAVYSFPATEIWKSDGTSAGTERIAVTGDIQGFKFIKVGNRVFLGDQFADRLYVLSEQLDRVIELPTEIELDPTFGDIFVYGELLLFRDANTRELWVSDGTVPGTVPLTSDPQHSFGADPRAFVEHEGLVYFSADNGEELWVTDGTPAGTRLLWQPKVDGIISRIIGMISFEDKLIIGFARFFNTDGMQLRGTYAVDVDAFTALRLAEVVPLPRDGGFAHTIIDDRLVYQAIDEDGSTSLWVTDGTPRGTRSVFLGAPSAQEAFSVGPDFITLGDAVYFVVDDGTHGAEPWVIR